MESEGWGEGERGDTLTLVLTRLARLNLPT